MPTESTVPPSLPPYDPTAAVAASAVHNDMAVIPMPDPVNVNVNVNVAAAMEGIIAPLPPLLHVPGIQQEATTTIPEAAAMLTATTTGNNKRSHPAEQQQRKKRKRRRTHYVEPTEPLPQGIPFNPSDHPELELDATVDHSKLVHAFQEPLFPKDPSATLSIAYTHRDAAVEERTRLRRKKRAALHELQELQTEFASKKRELLEMNSKLRASTRRVGGWTRTVFDLELKERSAWNDKLHALQNYVEEHGTIPEHGKKTKGTDVEKSLAAFVASVRSKVKKGHKSLIHHPHRMQALEAMGVHWESENDARFEIMFQKLLDYKKEHGTFRMPSLDLCKESGDEELIQLHNWVFSQVGSFRYQLRSKKLETIQRFLDIGFCFEKWYATNGHVFDRDIPPFNDIIQRYVSNGGVMDEKDVQVLRRAAEKSPRKGMGKKKKGGEKGKKGNKGTKKSEEEQADKEALEAAAAGGGAEGEDEMKVEATDEGQQVTSPVIEVEQQEETAQPAPMEGVEATAAVTDDVEATDTTAVVSAADGSTTATTEDADVTTPDAATDTAAPPAADPVPPVADPTAAPAVEQAPLVEEAAAPTKMEETAIDAAMESVVATETEGVKMEETAIDVAMEAVVATATEVVVADVHVQEEEENDAVMDNDEETSTQV